MDGKQEINLEWPYLWAYPMGQEGVVWPNILLAKKERVGTKIPLHPLTLLLGRQTLSTSTEVGSSLSTSPPCRLDHISHEEASVEPVQ